MTEYGIKEINREYHLIQIMTFVRYFGDCLFYGYIHLFLKSKGLLESEIGLVTAITPIVGLLVNPIWNIFSKNANSNRKLMWIITIIEGSFILLYANCYKLETFCLMTVLIAMVGTPFYTLHDGFSATFSHLKHKNYNRIRSIGTLAYLCATLVASLVLYLSKDNYSLLLFIGGTIFILVSIFFFFIKPLDLVDEKKKPIKRNYWVVLKNKTFWFYAIIYFLLVSATYASDSYVSLYFTSYRMVPSYYWSFIFGGYLLVEFLTLTALSYTKKDFNLSWGFLVIGLAYGLRDLAFALNLPIPFVIAMAMLRGVAYGFILTIHVKLITRICGIANITVAFFIVALGDSIIKALLSYGYGSLISYFGYQTFFLIAAMIVFVGFIMELIYLLKNHFTYPIYIEKELK